MSLKEVQMDSNQKLICNRADKGKALLQRITICYNTDSAEYAFSMTLYYSLTLALKQAKIVRMKINRHFISPPPHESFRTDC